MTVEFKLGGELSISKQSVACQTKKVIWIAEVYVWCWESCEIDIGHIAIQFDAHIYGFTFIGDRYPGPAIGDMRKETESELAKSYVKEHANNFMMHRGRPGADPNPENRFARVFNVSLPETEFISLSEQYDTLHLIPPVYDRRTCNCVTTTITVLDAADVLHLEQTFLPANLIGQLQDRVGKKVESELGEVLGERKVRVIYNKKKGFHWTEEAPIRR